MTFNTYGDKGNLNGSLNVAYGLYLGGKILSRILERNEIAIVHSDQAPACPAHLVMENDYFCRRKEPKQ